MSPTIMASPSAATGTVGNGARSAARPGTGETCGRRRRGGGLSRRGAAEQQRADHGPSRRDTRDDTV